MDNKQIPEDEQQEHLALSHTSEQSNLFQDIFNWLQKQINPSNINGVRQYPEETLELINNLKQKKERLESNYERLEQNHETLLRENARLNQDNQKLNQNSTYYYQQYTQQYQANCRSREENANLRSNNAALQEEINQLKKERDELDARVGLILSELAAYRRDPTTTYVSDDSRPQNHLLVQEFKEIKEQDYQRVSSNIFSHRCESAPSLKANRKQEIARIKSILSEEIMIKGMMSTEESASTRVMDSVCTALGMSADYSIAVLNEL